MPVSRHVDAAQGDARRFDRPRSSRTPDVAASHDIRFSLDWGTTQCKVAYEIAPKGDMADSRRQRTLRIQEHRNQVPQVLGFIRDHNTRTLTFHWGLDFQRRTVQERHREEDFFPFDGLKMCLYDSRAQRLYRQRAQDELLRLAAASEGTLSLTIEELMSLHLREIRQSVMTALCEELTHRFSAEQLHKMQQHWVFPVPEIATLATNETFARVIREAGFPKGIRLVTETEAATAYVVRECDWMTTLLPRSLKAGMPHPIA